MTKATGSNKKVSKVDKLLQIQKHYAILDELHDKLHNIRTVDRYNLNLSKPYNQIETEVEEKMVALESALLSHLESEYRLANKLYKEIQRESK